MYVCGFLKLASLGKLIFGRFALKKKKNGRLFGIVVEFEKTKDCWKEMIKAKERPLESTSLLEKK